MPAPPRPSRRRLVLAATMLVLALPAVVVAQIIGDITVIKDDESPGNAEIAVRLSEFTNPDSTSPRVVIGRNDLFVDSMSSALLQGQGPLLLVPPAGPIGERVELELLRLGAEQAVIMGGEAAVEDAVVEELEALGLQVQRRQGPTRFETAIDVARTDAPDATIAILARAFPAEGSSDPTQAWADSVAVGALAAEVGAPVLLSETDVLTGSTRDYLMGSSVQEVLLVGGTAALSQGVEDALAAMGLRTSRVAAASRFGTAIEVASRRDLDNPAEAARIVLVDGQAPDAWAAGFAAAGHAAATGAPIVLTNGEDIPPESEAYLAQIAGASFAQAGGPAFTCVVTPETCQQAREIAGLPRLPQVGYDPTAGSVLDRGDAVTVTLDAAGAAVPGPLTVQGTCLATGVATGPSPLTFAIADDAASGLCRVTVTSLLADGNLLSDEAVYPIAPDDPLGVAEQVAAAFTFSPATPQAGAPVTFTDASTGPVVEWLWDLGDGTTSTSQNAAHGYAAAGTYTVTLTVTGEGGDSDQTSQDVTVTAAGGGFPPGQPPTPPVFVRVDGGPTIVGANDDANVPIPDDDVVYEARNLEPGGEYAVALYTGVRSGAFPDPDQNGVAEPPFDTLEGRLTIVEVNGDAPETPIWTVGVADAAGVLRVTVDGIPAGGGVVTITPVVHQLGVGADDLFLDLQVNQTPLPQEEALIGAPFGVVDEIGPFGFDGNVSRVDVGQRWFIVDYGSNNLAIGYVDGNDDLHLDGVEGPLPPAQWLGQLVPGAYYVGGLYEPDPADSSRLQAGSNV